jgi:signal transduction histidine kinase
VKVLLVEDNPGDARLFAELTREIQGEPVRLTTVATLAAALEAAPGHEVVFLDLSLPDAHGIVTVSKMVAAARTLPIVVLTGNDDEHAALAAMQAGAQDYLHKADITPSLIARAARYAIERKAAEENAHKLAKSDEAARRARFISSLTAAITASFDLDATLPAVVKLLVPTLGDYAHIDLVRADGHYERAAAAATDPAMLAAGYVLERPIEQPLIARGRHLGTIVFALKAHRSFDEDLQQLAREVAERIALGIDNASLYHAAQRAIRGRDELLAVVSHDLRNPLNLIGLALQMLEQDPEALASALPSAKRGVDRMQRLIDDLLDVARIDTGTLSVEPRAISLQALLEEAFEQHRALAADKRISLVRELDRAGGVIADRHRMGQAISNLVGNALKFTPAGGTICIGGETRGDRAVLWVSDTGRGIPPEHLPRLFDRFWQPQRGRDGVGLGLAIVKGIVDAHSGTIEVDSKPGTGTTFRISLRATDVRASTEMAPLAAAR